MEEINQRLEKALKRREAAAATVQRIQGKLEAAQNDLAEVEEQIRAKKIEPDGIDDAIEKLQERYSALVDEIENGVSAAETALAPFLKET